MKKELFRHFSNLPSSSRLVFQQQRGVEGDLARMETRADQQREAEGGLQENEKLDVMREMIKQAKELVMKKVEEKPEEMQRWMRAGLREAKKATKAQLGADYSEGLHGAVITRQWIDFTKALLEQGGFAPDKSEAAALKMLDLGQRQDQPQAPAQAPAASMTATPEARAEEPQPVTPAAPAAEQAPATRPERSETYEDSTMKPDERTDVLRTRAGRLLDGNDLNPNGKAIFKGLNIETVGINNPALAVNTVRTRRQQWGIELPPQKPLTQEQFIAKLKQLSE